MTYQECVNYIDGILDSIRFEDIKDCCLQFNIIGRDNGVFYIEIRDHIASIVTDGDRTYNVKYIFTASVFSRLLKKIVDPIYAYTTGKFKLLGDVSLGRCILIKLCEANN